MRSALYYGAEYWALKKEYKKKLPITEMKMLRLICGKTSRDGISNEAIRDITGVKKIEEFQRKQRLRWFEHVKRMDDERDPMKAKKFVT